MLPSVWGVQDQEVSEIVSATSELIREYLLGIELGFVILFVQCWCARVRRRVL